MTKSPLMMDPEEFEAMLEKSNANYATHSWKYGHRSVECVFCGASKVVDGMKPCPVWK